MTDKSGHAAHRALAGALRRQARQVGESTPSVRGADVQKAVITGVPTDGTVQVGAIVARCLDSYPAPAVGDQVLLIQASSGGWWAVGRAATSAVGIGGITYRRKTADTPRASTTTATDDPHLTMQVAANAVYTVEGYMVYLAGGTGDMRIGLTAPTGATGAYTMRGPDLAAVAGGTTAQVRIQSLLDFTSTIPMGGQTPTYSSAHALGTIVTAGTAGTVAVKWAQNTSDPTASVLLAHSWLKLTRMS